MRPLLFKKPQAQAIVAEIIAHINPQISFV